MEAPFLRSWAFTVFVATASTSNPWMVTHSSANRGPSCWTSVILRELVFPTWYSNYCSGAFFTASSSMKSVARFLTSLLYLENTQQYTVPYNKRAETVEHKFSFSFFQNIERYSMYVFSDHILDTCQLVWVLEILYTIVEMPTHMDKGSWIWTYGF